jgi:hypothetical protein
MTLGRAASRGFLWRPGVGMLSLSSLLVPGSRWVILRAQSVNASGEIAAVAYDQQAVRYSAPRAVLLKPVAEPGR